MTSEQLHDALTLLPEDLVARADEFRCRKPKGIPFRRYAALAACFAVLLTSALFVRNLRQKFAVSEMAAAAPFDAMKDTGVEAAESPRMEAATGSQKSAAADSVIPFACSETPYHLNGTASYAHGSVPSVMASRAELDGYLSKWGRLYLLDALRDICEIYDEDWFASRDLLLIPIDYVTGSCAVTDMAITDGACKVTIAIAGEGAAEPTNYHITIPVEKGTVSDPQNITIIYKSDTTG